MMAYSQDGRLVYQDEAGLLDLPPPALVGHHQFDNAALAVAAVRQFGLPISESEIAKGLRTVVWPARIQPLRATSSAIWLPARKQALARWRAQRSRRRRALALSLQEMRGRAAS